MGGSVSTAGGVVFFGDDDGQLVGRCGPGKHLWNFNMGQGSPRRLYHHSVDGKQYVSIAAATSVFTFGLFGP